MQPVCVLALQHRLYGYADAEMRKIMSNDRYTSPLSERYASKEMQYIFHQTRSLRHGGNYGLHLLKLKMSLGLRMKKGNLQLQQGRLKNLRHMQKI